MYREKPHPYPQYAFAERHKNSISTEVGERRNSLPGQRIPLLSRTDAGRGAGDALEDGGYILAGRPVFHALAGLVAQRIESGAVRQDARQ